jgi:hypothetical protein
MHADIPPVVIERKVEVVDKKHDKKKKPAKYDARNEPTRPPNLPDGAWWDGESGIWRDRDGNPIGGG